MFFINDMYDWTERMFSKLADDTKLKGVVDSPGGTWQAGELKQLEPYKMQREMQSPVPGD